MKRLLLAVLLTGAGCRRAPGAALTWRECWEMLVFTEAGGIVDVRVTVGNTGVLRGQGHLRFDHWPDEESPVLMSRDAGPAAVSVDEHHDRVWVGTDILGLDEAGRWYARSSSPDAAGLLQVSGEGPVPPPAAWMEGGGQWSISAPVTLGTANGWIEAGKRGGALRGRAVVLHSAGDGWPSLPRQAAYVLGSGVAVGIDRHGKGQLAWAEVEGRTLSVTSAALDFPSRGPVHLDFRPGADLQVDIKRRGHPGRRAPYERLHPVERWLLQPFVPEPRRHVQKGHATITFEGHTIPAPAILLWIDAARPRADLGEAETQRSRDSAKSR